MHVEHLALVERARRADEHAYATMNTLAAISYSPSRRKSISRKSEKDTFAEGEPVQLDVNICIAQANAIES